MKKLFFLFGLFVMVLCHSTAFAQEQEPKKDEKEPPKKAKVKVEKMESHKIKRNFRNDEYIRRPKSTSRAENKKLRKAQKEQRKKYDDRLVDEQHAGVTRRMRRNERKANKFNETRSQTLSQSSKDANKMHFSLGWIFHRNNQKPGVNGASARDADKFNASRGASSQSARDANKVHFSLGWLFHRDKSKPSLSSGSQRKANRNNSSKSVKSQSARDANKIHISLGWLFHRKANNAKGGGGHKSYKGKN